MRPARVTGGRSKAIMLPSAGATAAKSLRPVRSKFKPSAVPVEGAAVLGDDRSADNAEQGLIPQAVTGFLEWLDAGQPDERRCPYCGAKAHFDESGWCRSCGKEWPYG